LPAEIVEPLPPQAYFRPARWPSGCGALMTTRLGGVSVAPFDSLNLRAQTDDPLDHVAVAENRRRLAATLGAAPVFLDQVHGTRVVRLGAQHLSPAAPAERADAAITTVPGIACTVLVADCLPVLFATRDGRAVGAAHAGWRGLAAGVLEATIAAMDVPAAKLCAWLGPAIGPEHFEVGAEVRAAFVAANPAAAAGFSANPQGRWQCDLALLARQRLTAAGLTRLDGASHCTYADAARCYSYRRDGQTGRMAALLWLH